MKPLFLVTALCSLAVFTPDLALADNFKRIQTEEAYRAAVVGKKLTDGRGNWYIIHANGKITGKVGKDKVRGAWNWQRRMYCRNVMVGKKDIGPDCQTVFIDGTTVKGVRKNGKGKSYTLKIN